MPTFKSPRNISRKHELREDTVVTFYARAWRFFDDNRALVYGVLGGIVAIALAALGYALYRNDRAAEAEEALALVAPFYEDGRYQEALDGTPDVIGLVEIVKEYGGAPSGNLARFHAADAFFRLGDHDRAIDYFRDFDKGANFIGVAALAGEAAAWEQRGEYDRAGDLYRRAARHFENELTTPEYLLEAGRAYEMAGRYDDARRQYEAVEEEYPQSSQAGSIQVYIARVVARQNS